METIGYAAFSASSDLKPYHFKRRVLRDNDVAIEILYSGICHSDLHTVKGDWGQQPYPLVPGHEIIGQVIFGWKKCTEIQSRGQSCRWLYGG